MPPTHAREIREQINAASQATTPAPEGGKFHPVQKLPKEHLVASIEHLIAHIRPEDPQFTVRVARYEQDDVHEVFTEYRQHGWTVITFSTDHATPASLGHRPVTFLHFQLK